VKRLHASIDVIDCNLKRNYQILIIFDVNILDTTGQQMAVQAVFELSGGWGRLNPSPDIFKTPTNWQIMSSLSSLTRIGEGRSVTPEARMST